jgi:hypothetical protein
MEGSYLVPTTFNPSADLFSAQGSMKQVFGMAGWGLPSANPPSISLFGTDTFLGVPVVTNAYYTADVTP